jgi:hypothetical protein
MPELNVNAPACFIHSPNAPEINLGTATLDVSAIIQGRSLKRGGRYGWGLFAKGDCGNISFVNIGRYIDIPKRCGKDLSCVFNYKFLNTLFPKWVNRIELVRTENLNPFELQWIIDKVEYIDGKVRITIQSLNDYNFKNLFKTNTVYEYLKGDRVEFIADELNNYYCNSLNYQILSPVHDKIISGQTAPPANYFNQILIDDDGRVGKLIKEGTVIELQRPFDTARENVYYSIGVELAVVNGQLVNPIGQFETFDTYLVNRQIGANAVTLEHHSPSDFFGNHLSDIGKPYIVNEFEDEKRYDRLVTICDADDFNNFSGVQQTIGDASMGGIIAIGTNDDKVLLAIFEHDNKVLETADDLLRIRDGVAIAAPSGEILSDNKVSLIGRYGCQYEHIGSILFGDGFATWADVNRNAYIVHDYQSAKEASFGKIGAWCTKRFQEMQTWNNSLPKADPNTPLNKFRFSTGYNNHNGMVYLTIKQLRQSGIDNAYKPYINTNETICYHPLTDRFYGQPSFTPEGYANINLYNGKGSAFLTFLKGGAWSHPTMPEKWGEFYGVPVDEVVQFVSNKYPEKIKQWNALQLQSNLMWYIFEALTDKLNFISETPPAMMESEQNGEWNGAFLGNINSREGLYGSEVTTGYWAKITLIRDNTDNLQYLSIDNAKRLLFDEMDLIITKFMLSEESGFTESL